MEADGINVIQYRPAMSLGIPIDSEETRRREELWFLDDEEEGIRAPVPVVPVVKLQRRGTIEIFTLGITSVGTWSDLRKAIKENFKSGDTEPQISTFDGTLIQSAKDYMPLLKPDLHLIIYFQPTMEELSQSLNTLFFNNESPLSWPEPNPANIPPNSISDQSQLANYLSSSSTAPEALYQSRKYHLQPPTIHFSVSSPTPISITLTNSSFKSMEYIAAKKYMKSREGVIESETLPDAYVPDLNSNFTGPLGTNPGDYTIVKEDSGLPTRPSGDISLPPWSPFPLYKKRVERSLDSNERYRIVSGGVFPVTTFDLFAQSQKKRVLCSMAWEVIASPSGKLVDLVSEEEMSCIRWALKSEGDGGEYRKTSEKRVYANYEDPSEVGNDSKECQEAGWWMAGPGRLPTEFTGEIGEHTFLLNGVGEVASHLNAFMERCGIGKEIVQDFVTYWTKNLELDETPMRITAYEELANIVSVCGREPPPRLILMKFLSPRDLRNLLPLLMAPEPHRIVRLFAVFRVIEESELLGEGIDACGDFELEVNRVLGGIGSCGGGLNCGHRGFKVAEVGGVRVFGKGSMFKDD